MEKDEVPIDQLMNVCSAAPVAVSQSLTVNNAATLPSGEGATYVHCPSSVCSAAPVAASQSLTVLSYEADATT